MTWLDRSAWYFHFGIQDFTSGYFDGTPGSLGVMDDTHGYDDDMTIAMTLLSDLQVLKSHMGLATTSVRISIRRTQKLRDQM